MERREEFIANLYPAARRVAQDSGVPERELLAYAAIESDWGERIPPGTNNLFGLQADAGWTGARHTHSIPRYVDGRREDVAVDVRAYPSLEAGLRDWVESRQARHGAERELPFQAGQLRLVADSPSMRNGIALANRQLREQASGGTAVAELQSGGYPLITDSEHPAHSLFVAVDTALKSQREGKPAPGVAPQAVTPEMAAAVTYEAMRNGIRSPDRLLSVDVEGAYAFVRGVDGIGHAKVDISAPTDALDVVSKRIAELTAPVIEAQNQDPVQRSR